MSGKTETNFKFYGIKEIMCKIIAGNTNIEQKVSKRINLYSKHFDCGIKFDKALCQSSANAAIALFQYVVNHNHLLLKDVNKLDFYKN